MRDKQHYLNLLDSNPNASVGISLAAAAVFAAEYGVCEPEDRGNEEWKRIYRRLHSMYGETMTPDEVMAEIENPPPTDLITQAQAAALAGQSVANIGAAIDKGHLVGYLNPSAPRRQGRRMVSEAAVRTRWLTEEE